MKRAVSVFVSLSVFFFVSCGSMPEGDYDESAEIVEAFSGLALRLSPDGDSGVKPSYAIVNLSSDTENAEMENYVTDALAEAIFKAGKVRILERAFVSKVLSEQAFQASGFVNDATAKSIGNLTGADFVCYGTIIDSDDYLIVNARVVNVETGEVWAMGRANVYKDEYLYDISE